MKVKAHELRTKGKHELLKQEEELRTELSQLRVSAQTGGAPAKLAKIKVVRKSIARVLTVLYQKEKQNLRKVYKGKTYKPKDLRPRRTRAKRMALTPTQKKAKTVRGQKRAKAFPMRKYAIRLA
eukprot:334484_1